MYARWKATGNPRWEYARVEPDANLGYCRDAAIRKAKKMGERFDVDVSGFDDWTRGGDALGS